FPCPVRRRRGGGRTVAVGQAAGMGVSQELPQHRRVDLQDASSPSAGPLALSILRRNSAIASSCWTEQLDQLRCSADGANELAQRHLDLEAFGQKRATQCIQEPAERYESPHVEWRRKDDLAPRRIAPNPLLDIALRF